MEIKLGITLIAAALPCAMWIPIKHGGYFVVSGLLIAGVLLVISAPALPKWGDDDTSIPAPLARPRRRLRPKKPRVSDPTVPRDKGNPQDSTAHDPSPPAA